jgi:hypothetical protein
MEIDTLDDLEIQEYLPYVGLNTILLPHTDFEHEVFFIVRKSDGIIVLMVSYLTFPLIIRDIIYYKDDTNRDEITNKFDSLDQLFEFYDLGNIYSQMYYMVMEEQDNPYAFFYRRYDTQLIDQLSNTTDRMRRYLSKTEFLDEDSYENLLEDMKLNIVSIGSTIRTNIETNGIEQTEDSDIEIEMDEE